MVVIVEFSNFLINSVYAEKLAFCYQECWVPARSNLLKFNFLRGFRYLWKKRAI